MRMRAAGVDGTWTSRPGAVLIHPGAGLEAFDLDDCVVLASLADTVTGAGTTHLVVDRPLPEEIDTALERAEQSMGAGGEVSVTFLLEAQGAPTLEYVLTSGSGQNLSVAVVETRGRRIVVGLEQSQEHDRPLDDLLVGLRLSDLSRGETLRRTERDLREENRVLRHKLLDLLSFSLESASRPPDGARGQASVPDSVVPAPDSVRGLEDEVIRLTRDRDALQRKYTALAESRLGRITLDRWERRRR